MGQKINMTIEHVIDSQVKNFTVTSTHRSLCEKFEFSKISFTHFFFFWTTAHLHNINVHSATIVNNTNKNSTCNELFGVC